MGVKKAMKPKYPHIADDKIPKALTVVQNPDASMITEIPPLGTLMGAVADYLKEAGAESANSEIKLTDPGVVMVLKKGTTGKPFGDWEAAEVMNSTLHHAELSSKNGAWVEANKRWLGTQMSPKMKTADPNLVYGQNGALIGCSATPDNGGNTNGQWDKVMKRILINAHVEKGGMIVHEYLHTFDHWDPSDIGWGMDEGFVEFFARDLTARHDYLYVGNWSYQGGYLAVKDIIAKVGLAPIVKFWFLRDPAMMGKAAAKSKAIASHVIPNEKWDYTSKMIDEFCAPFTT